MADGNSRLDKVMEVFKTRFGHAPEAVVRAPGRVELIGNHTDYNDGFVMPAAIDRDVLIALSPSGSKTSSLWSLNFEEPSEFSHDSIVKTDTAAWSNYVRGVIDQLQKAGYDVPGLQMAIEGNVPLGGGLSSSAAIEVAAALGALVVMGMDMSGPEIAKLCQRAENQFVGVSSGIMDQFISAVGQEGKALVLDCRSLDYNLAKLPEGTKIVVADTKKPRTLAGSEYNIRRAQCEEAVSILQDFLPGITALRDVSIADLDKYDTHLPEIVKMRAKHVVHENDRVLKCVEALNAGQADEFGKLLSASHISSRDLYHNSSQELDWLVEAAWKVPGCLGSRLSGAGFGGCTVSIVKDDAVEGFKEAVASEYAAKAGYEPAIDVMCAAKGAERLA